MKEKGEKAPEPPLTCTRPSGRHQRRQRGGSSARLGTRSSRRTCSEREGKGTVSVKRDSATGAPPVRKRDSPADGLAVGAALRRMKSRGRGQGQGGEIGYAGLGS